MRQPVSKGQTISVATALSVATGRNAANVTTVTAKTSRLATVKTVITATALSVAKGRNALNATTVTVKTGRHVTARIDLQTAKTMVNVQSGQSALNATGIITGKSRNSQKMAAKRHNSQELKAERLPEKELKRKNTITVTGKDHRVIKTLKTTMATTKIGITAIAALLLLASCDKKRVFDEYKELDGWSRDSTLTFNYESADTTQLYNVFVTTRTNNSYPYSNIFLIVQMEQPGTKLIKVDTLEYQMANPDGTLMGSGFSDVKESKLWYKENVKFPKKGNYKFSIQQAVRKANEIPGVQQLDGVTEVGLRIEKK